MSPLTNLLQNPNTLANLNLANAAANATFLIANINKAIKNYCSVGLGLKNCDKPFPADNIPTLGKNGDCRFCTSCGNGYEQSGGGFTMDSTSYKNFFRSYGNACSENYGTHDTPHGVSLCCRPEDHVIVSASCYNCLTCGNGYENAGGTNVNTSKDNWRNWFSELGRDCSGSISSYPKTGDNQPLWTCCKKQGNNPSTICTMCSQCGGSWTQERGAIGVDLHQNQWNGWFRSRGDNCAGDIQQPTHVTDGVKLCCQEKN